MVVGGEVVVVNPAMSAACYGGGLVMVGRAAWYGGGLVVVGRGIKVGENRPNLIIYYIYKIAT